MYKKPQQDTQTPPPETTTQRNHKRVLSHATPSYSESIANALVIKHENIFFLCDENGEVPCSCKHGYGLYYHDTRYLSGYEIRLDDKKPAVLMTTATLGFQADIQAANPEMCLEDKEVPKESLGIRLKRLIDSQQLALQDLFELENYLLEPLTCEISIRLRVAFEDIFAVRGITHEPAVAVAEPKWEDGKLHFTHQGKDGICRKLVVGCSRPPDERHGRELLFRFVLAPKQKQEMLISVTISETPQGGRAAVDQDKTASAVTALGCEAAKVTHRQLETAADRWFDQATTITSDSQLVNRVIHRSLTDLFVLRSHLDGEGYFAAGVPWFCTLFGRDSLITALQTKTLLTGVATQTLRLLAKFQGKKKDRWKDEQPGKILHELRVDELTHTGDLPYSPYYGSVDATILFLITVARDFDWTGNRDLIKELRAPIDAAFAWIDTYGDSDGDGYVDYSSTSAGGLINQGWKDSGDAIVNSDGTIVTPPVALVEVQGEVYMARTLMASVFDRMGEADRAREQRNKAEDLKKRFNRDYWMPDKEFYALALEKGGKQAAVVSSNPGQALWTGIINDDRASHVADRLMAPDMYSGWGVRTLSSQEKRFNPISYHLGTVWPHDNSLIAAGLRRYGFDKQAMQICDSILAAASWFPHYRLPELFAGYDRKANVQPVRYPVACHPQAWAAGSVPFLIEQILGLKANAVEHRLHIVRPMLPSGCNRLELARLQVGQARVDLRFVRVGDSAYVEVLKKEGDLEVLVELQA